MPFLNDIPQLMACYCSILL